MAANAKARPEAFTLGVDEAADRVKKVSINWRMLIARIYETDSLTCSSCGKKITILSFVTQPGEIRRILGGTIWPLDPSEFDPPYELDHWSICQLVTGTKDGFPEDIWQIECDIGPDPPWVETCDPPHWEDNSDSPHFQDQVYIDPPHCEE